MKEMMEYWEDNVATDEELELPFEERLELATDWQACYYDHLYEEAKDRMMFSKE